MVYLDHAATTDLRPEAREVWLAAAAVTGNPSSLHRAGRDARRLVEESRERAAAALGVPPASLVFTSGGTESDNLAIVGTVAAQRDSGGGRTILLPRTEHKAVLEPAEALGDVEWIDVHADGRVHLDHLQDLLRDHDPALVCVMAVNNETGVVQPIAEVADLCRAAGVPLHVDAVQALGVIRPDGVDATTVAFSAHKVGGPMGVGLLRVLGSAEVRPIVRGGGHESGLRAGTPDVAGIHAAAVAVELAAAEQAAHAEHLASLREALLSGLAALPDLRYDVNSPNDGAPGIVNVGFPGCESDALMMLLDAAGIEVSTGSACTVGIPRPSHVLLAMGRSAADARSALRVSFGRTSTREDADALLAVLPDAVARARRAGQLAVAGGA